MRSHNQNLDGVERTQFVLDQGELEEESFDKRGCLVAHLHMNLAYRCHTFDLCKLGWDRIVGFEAVHIEERHHMGW